MKTMLAHVVRNEPRFMCLGNKLLSDYHSFLLIQYIEGFDQYLLLTSFLFDKRQKIVRAIRLIVVFDTRPIFIKLYGFLLRMIG